MHIRVCMMACMRVCVPDASDQRRRVLCGVPLMVQGGPIEKTLDPKSRAEQAQVFDTSASERAWDKHV